MNQGPGSLPSSLADLTAVSTIPSLDASPRRREIPGGGRTEAKEKTSVEITLAAAFGPHAGGLGRLQVEGPVAFPPPGIFLILAGFSHWKILTQYVGRN